MISQCLVTRWSVYRQILSIQVALMLLIPCHVVMGLDNAEQMVSSISPSRDALADSAWYDTEVKSIVSIPVQTQDNDSIHRDSRWLPRADAVPDTVGTNSSTVTPWTWSGEGFRISTLITWILLLVVVVGSGVWVAWILGRNGSSNSLSGSNSLQSLSAEKRLLERIQHLPEELRRENLDYRSEVQRLMQAGVFDQAVILLYAYQLLLLDRAACLRLTRGKTNRQYLREVRFSEEIGSHWFGRVINLFEQSYFGKIDIIKSEFDRCWKETEMLEGRLASRMEGSE